MLDYEMAKYEWLAHTHQHDDGSQPQFSPRAAGDAAEFDPERDWNGTMYDCSCGQTIVIAPGREPEPTAEHRRE